MTSVTDQAATAQPRGRAGRVVRWMELMLPTMAEIRDARPWAQPVLLGWVLSLLTAWLTVPLVTLVLPDQQGAATSLIQGWMWAMAALAPLVQGGRALLWTVATWALLTLGLRETSVRSLFSFFLYGEVLLAIHGLLLALFFQWTVDPGAIGPSFADPLSLATYVPSDHGLWGGLVKHLTLVQAGWVAYVGLGGRRVVGLEAKGAWTLALTLWVGTVAVSAVRISMHG